jgi:prolyl-tRNA synthetase
MRASRSLIPTVKEIPADAEVASHILMVRAGMIRKVAAGIYTVLPLGLRVMRKIERIVRQEMDAAGGQEVSMPVVIPAELWVRSGRWDYYGPELMRIKDRKGTDFCLGPTHEEVITQLAADEIRSYKQLPLNLYQIQTKFRDEIRPRFGLMRGREFIMKDAYSFDADHDAATASYWRMHEAYTRIFKRCGLGFRAVEADTGTIGGSLSHEFQVLADSGEDQIVACDSCDYAANTEKAALRPVAPSSAHDGPAIEAVATPAAHSIDAVSALLGIEPSRLIKALVFTADGEPVMALVRGDRALCEAKLRALLGADKLEAASESEVLEAVGGPVGFVGPVGAKVGLPILADPEVMALDDAVCGANQTDLHSRNVQPARDLVGLRIADLRAAVPGDRCPRCEAGSLTFRRGVEVGHIFYLGTKYSQAMGASILDVNGKRKPMEMGCYGIGIGRTAAACIEQHHDQHGIVWPVPVAPFEVHLLALGKEAEVAERCESVYAELAGLGLEVLYDDRKERPGFKFKDAELIGLPWRVSIGRRGLDSGLAEVVERKTLNKQEIPFAELAAFLQGHIEAARAPLG